MRRGMTMVEIVLALSLLAVLAVAVASWTQVAAHAAATAGPDQWRAVAEAVLQLIHDDIAAGDFRGKRGDPRVRVVEQTLQVETRGSTTGGPAGPVLHRYCHDPAAGAIVLQQHTEGGRQRARLLLDRVQTWEVTIDEERRSLTVTIGMQESLVSRKFVIR